MSTRIQHRRDTAANWTSVNPVLAAGEFGVETDTLKFKHGDGVTAWTALGYSGGGAGGASDATTAIKGILRLGGDLGGTADSPTVNSGTNHTHTAAQVSDATTTGRSVLTAATALAARDAIAAPAKSSVEGLVAHDGTSGGGVRPTGFYRVRWIGGSSRPTNMAAGDIWETT